MPAKKHVIELLPAYVLGSLEENEAGRVGAHLTSCPRCQRELASYQAVADALGTAVPQVDPPGAIKRRLLRRVRGWRGIRRSLPGLGGHAARRRALPAWGIAGLALILLLAAGNLFLWGRLTRSEVLTGPQGMRAVALQSADAAPGAGGIVIISADGQDGVLVVDRLPQLPEGQQYQVWLFKGGENTPGPVFSVDESGYRGVRIRAPESLLVYESVQVTVEPSEGGARPSGDLVLTGSLHNR